MSGDIRSILERMTAIESELTPVTVKSGLNRQQKSVDELPALFRPRKISVLGAKTDPKHPMGKHLVGATEGRLAETMADIEEDMLSRMRHDLNAYLDKLGDHHSDDGQRDHNPQSRDKLGDKPSQDLGLVDRAIREIDAAPAAPAPTNKPCKIVALEDGTILEIHGDDTCGYEVRRGSRRVSKRFPSIALAETMLDLFRAHRADRSLEQDYVDER